MLLADERWGMVDANWLKTTRARADADEKELLRLVKERDRIDAQVKIVSERVQSWRVILASIDGAREPVRRPAVQAAGQGAEPSQEGGGLRATIRGGLGGGATGRAPEG